MPTTMSQNIFGSSDDSDDDNEIELAKLNSRGGGYDFGQSLSAQNETPLNTLT